MVRLGGSGEVEDLQVGSQSIASDSGKTQALSTALFTKLQGALGSQQQAIADSWSKFDAVCTASHVPVSPNEIIATIKNLRSKAALGLDGISGLVLKICLFIFLPFLWRLYNDSLQLGYVSVSWRKSKFIALKKPGKTDYSVVRSYGPISFLSILGKTL